MQIPKKGKIYSVNEGNAKNWDKPTTKYVRIHIFYSLQCRLSYFGNLISKISFNSKDCFQIIDEYNVHQLDKCNDVQAQES